MVHSPNILMMHSAMILIKHFSTARASSHVPSLFHHLGTEDIGSNVVAVRGMEARARLVTRLHLRVVVTQHHLHAWRVRVWHPGRVVSASVWCGASQCVVWCQQVCGVVCRETKTVVVIHIRWYTQ